MLKLNQDSKGKRFKLVRPLVTHNNCLHKMHMYYTYNYIFFLFKGFHGLVFCLNRILVGVNVFSFFPQYIHSVH